MVIFIKKQLSKNLIRFKQLVKVLILSSLLGIYPSVFADQKVIIAVIDGARYTESFGAGSANIPYIWDQMRPAGTIYTNFYNFGETNTNPGHASIATGTWQYIANDGSERPLQPTIFEYFRYQTDSIQSKNYVVAGKSKLDILTHSTHADYGSSYQASSNTDDVDDNTTYSNLISVMDNEQPNLVIVNFASVDRAGHSGDWDDYLASIQTVDLLIYQLWQKIQTDEYYRDETTLFVTNDHGRHDDAHGGFQNHGDSCEGCRHLMLLVIGSTIPAGRIIEDIRDQRDLAPTVGNIMEFDTPLVDGISLFEGDTPLPVVLTSFSAIQNPAHEITIQWCTKSEINNLGFNVLRSQHIDEGYVILNSNLIAGQGNSSSKTLYSYNDKDIVRGKNYYYQLQSISYDGITKMHGPIECKQMNYNFENNKSNLIVYPNTPNPFNSSTNIHFYLTEPASVKLTIYDNLGQQITVVHNGSTQAGVNTMTWSADHFASGLYFFTIESTHTIVKGKMHLVK
jgi:hypothetical protein